MDHSCQHTTEITTLLIYYNICEPVNCSVLYDKLSMIVPEHPSHGGNYSASLYMMFIGYLNNTMSDCVNKLSNGCIYSEGNVHVYASLSLYSICVYVHVYLC